MVNKVILVGRLGKDPETRYTQGGEAVCNFSVATDESYKDRSGERQKRTEWHRVVVWGKLAEVCQQYLIKGSQVYLEGKIQSRSWDDKNGDKRYAFEIVCHEMKMLGGTKKRESGDEPRSPSEQPDTPYVADDSDIPF